MLREHGQGAWRRLSECSGADCDRCLVQVDGVVRRACLRLAGQCGQASIEPARAAKASPSEAEVLDPVRTEAVRPASCRYATPPTRAALLEAVAAHQAAGRSVGFLAGGLGLVPRMKLHAAEAPDVLFDLSAIDGLQLISSSTDAGMVVGSAVTIGRLLRSNLVAAHAGELFWSVAAGGGLDSVSRQAATLGGVIARPSPAGAWHACLWALDASVVLVGEDGVRTAPSDQFFAGLPASSRRPGELIVSLEIPPLAELGFAGYQARHGLGVCVNLRFDPAGRVRLLRVAVHGLTPEVYRAHDLERGLVGVASERMGFETARIGMTPPCPAASSMPGRAIVLELLVELLEQSHSQLRGRLRED